MVWVVCYDAANDSYEAKQIERTDSLGTVAQYGSKAEADAHILGLKLNG